MSIKRNWAIKSGLIIALVWALAGCASTTQPMTQKIADEAMAIGNVKKFQYYISRNLVLTKVEDPVFTGIESGSGQVTTKSTFQIPSGTAGELMKTETDPRTQMTVYYIAFEAGNDNCLRFSQTRDGKEEKIYLVYDDPANETLEYGGAVYKADWEAAGTLKAKADDTIGKVKGKIEGISSDDTDQPYLLIKIKEKEDYQKVSGRKVGG